MTGIVGSMLVPGGSCVVFSGMLSSASFAACCLWRRRRKKVIAARIAISAAPPTAPPMMAPVWVFFPPGLESPLLPVSAVVLGTLEVVVSVVRLDVGFDDDVAAELDS